MNIAKISEALSDPAKGRKSGSELMKLRSGRTPLAAAFQTESDLPTTLPFTVGMQSRSENSAAWNIRFNEF
jgi:hypothetical protein